LNERVLIAAKNGGETMFEDQTAYRKMSDAAGKRAARLRNETLETWAQFERGNPLAAENAPARIEAAQVRRKLQVRDVEAKTLAGAETLQGDRNNFIPVSFLGLGAQVARSVARVHVRATNKVGSGFLCAPGLFITNFHVLPSLEVARSAFIEFDFVDEDPVNATHFSLDPNRCFVFDDVQQRDYAIVAVGPRISGVEPIEAFGWSPLSNAGNKHSLGEFANIIQHPNGEPKQVVLQDNLIAARDDFVLHYFADTETGSSGAPVFNNNWQVIALHHWGHAFNLTESAHAYRPDSVNEGIRISQIVEHARDQRDSLLPSARASIESMLQIGALQDRPSISVTPHRGSTPAPVQLVTQPVAHSAQESAQFHYEPSQQGGAAVWTIPLQVAVSFPGVAGESNTSPFSQLRPDQSNQPSIDGAEDALPRTGEGYRADFLDNHIIELPTLNAATRNKIAPLLDPDAHPSAKEGELQFTHFSTIVNKDRKLPFFGACNVDGATLFGISSSSQTEFEYADENEALFRADLAGAEGSHSWKPDDRISKSFQTMEKWYTRTNKLKPRPNTNDAEEFKSIADFDRGHIVRRTEPIWGTSSAAQAANRQTYNHANAAPQTPEYNQDKDRLPADFEDGEEMRSWYGMEVAVLRAATDDNTKMNIFTGPIFEETDPIYGPGKPGGGDRQVPLTYWKIAVWEKDGELKALAMKYTQEWSLKPGTGEEALNDLSELFLLRDFLTTVQDIQDRTGILFGVKVRNADIFGGFDGDDFSNFTMDDFAAALGPGV